MIRCIVAGHRSKGMTKHEHRLVSMIFEETSGLRPPVYPMIETRGFIHDNVEIVDCLTIDDVPLFISFPAKR